MLWDTSLLHSLPPKLLSCLHREVCSIRSRGWGTLSSKRARVYERGWNALCDYHTHVMAEMSERGWNYNRRWSDYSFRGAHHPEIGKEFLNDYTVTTPLYTADEISVQNEALLKWKEDHHDK